MFRKAEEEMASDAATTADQITRAAEERRQRNALANRPLINRSSIFEDSRHSLARSS